jgi:hypothetical protein
VTASLETAKPVVAVKTKPVLGFEPDTGQAVDVIRFDVFHIDSVRFEYGTNEKYPLSLSPAQARRSTSEVQFLCPRSTEFINRLKIRNFRLELKQNRTFFNDSNISDTKTGTFLYEELENENFNNRGLCAVFIK